MLLAALAGYAMGAAYLVTLPVEEVVTMPKKEEIKPGTVYLIKGQTFNSAWPSKQSRLAEAGQEVLLKEADVNYWARGLKTPKMDEDAIASIVTGSPVFNIEKGHLYATSKSKIKALQYKGEVLVHIEGAFAAGEPPKFLPKELMIGSWRLPFGLRDLIWSRISRLYTVDDASKALWENVTKASVEGDQLKIATKG